MIAIISDIHANAEALRAVIEDIRKKNIEQVFVIGDVVGYGPNPVECLHMVRELCPEIILRGNHESALLGGCPDNMRSSAKEAIEWTKSQLSRDELDYIGSWPTQYDIGDLMAVHGSPRDHVMEYIFPFDILRKDKMVDVFGHIPHKHCLVGHTHIPGVFSEDLQFIKTDTLLGNVYLLGEEKAIINVGSVGQPRDRDPRSCYVTFDGEAVIFRRVEYDYTATQRKICEIPSLDRSLAQRLKLGR